METLRPNQQRATQAIRMIWVVFVVQLIAVVSGYFQHELLLSIERGELVTDAQADSNDLRERILRIVYLIAYITSAVFFIRWFRRAYYNLHIVQPYLNYTEGWAALGWFIPIVSWFRPLQVISEMHRESQTLFEKHNIPLPVKSARRYIVIWWSMWLIWNLLGSVVFNLARSDMKTLDQLLNYSRWSMLFDLLTIPLSIAAVKVILDYAAIENQLPVIHRLELEAQELPHAPLISEPNPTASA